MSSTAPETKTIHEMLAEAPDVDVRETWEAFWQILSDARDRITAALPVTAHPSSANHGYYTSGGFEGSLNTYTGPGMDWFVHSWIGNRERSILDMNITAWLGQETDVPHLCIVFGTVPQVFFYSDFIARRDLAADVEYMNRYYEPENADYLKLRGDSRFTWSVSHGTYMRSVLSPVGHSCTAERTPETVEVLRQAVTARVDRWLGYVRDAQPVLEAERPALRARDHYLRRHTYRLDPMNSLAEKFMGAEMVETMVALRSGEAELQPVGGR